MTGSAFLGGSSDEVVVSSRLSFGDLGVIHVMTGKVELGQGILTAFIQIVAEELDVVPSRVHVTSGDTRGPDEWYTAGSLSVEVAGEILRATAAAARAALLEVAAETLAVEVRDLVIEDGSVLCGSEPTGLTLWSLSKKARLERSVSAIGAKPKVPSTYTLVGSNLPRVDLIDRIKGYGFIQDIALPGMLHGRILRKGGGRSLISVDLEALSKIPAVTQVVHSGSFLGIMSESEFGAVEASRKAEVHLKWSCSEVAFPDALLLGSNAEPETVVDNRSGNLDKDNSRLSGRFQRPFLAHASIGPSCGIALWERESLTVWSHSQGVFALRKALAGFFLMDEDKVRVIHAPNAGCYGHNGADDVALDAALLAQSCPGRAVRVLWSREAELVCSPFGPPMQTTIELDLDWSGKIKQCDVNIVSGPHGTRPGAGGGVNLLAATQVDTPIPIVVAADFPTSLGGGADRNAVPLYDLPYLRVRKQIVQTPARCSSLRALGAYLNVFAIESMMDEAANLKECDPLEYRLRHLSDPRGRAVLERVSEMASWPGDGSMGIGFSRYKNKAAYCAVVVELDIDEAVLVKRAWCAVDAGLVVNPDGASNQVEGGIIQSISWTLKESVDSNALSQDGFDWSSYPILTFSEVPEMISVEFLSSDSNEYLGVGEVSQGPTAAAIGNAVARCLGQRIYSLPITRDRLIAAMT